MKILYIDSTVRSNSRTAILAEYLLNNLSGDKSVIKLCETVFPAVDEKFLSKRDRACRNAISAMISLRPQNNSQRQM